MNTDWALDREIVLTRVYAASPDRVFRAFSDPDSVGRWFGPEGFVCTVHQLDFRVGGRWTFDFVGPDGTLWTNRVDYLQIEPNRLLVYDHGSDVDDDPARFRVTITFDEQADGKTVLTLRQLHPTPEQREAAIGFGAVELGLQTLTKLERHLAQ
jgi:uncharacterized protein YndB with AHSA1/START domain